MQTRFNATVVFFRIDKEKSLKKEFDKIISVLKIVYKLFALYIFEQNDYFERKEKVLTMKTRIMRI